MSVNEREQCRYNILRVYLFLDARNKKKVLHAAKAVNYSMEP